MSDGGRGARTIGSATNQGPTGQGRRGNSPPRCFRRVADTRGKQPAMNRARFSQEAAGLFPLAEHSPEDDSEDPSASHANRQSTTPPRTEHSTDPATQAPSRRLRTKQRSRGARRNPARRCATQIRGGFFLLDSCPCRQLPQTPHAHRVPVQQNLQQHHRMMLILSVRKEVAAYRENPAQRRLLVPLQSTQITPTPEPDRACRTGSQALSFTSPMQDPQRQWKATWLRQDLPQAPKPACTSPSAASRPRHPELTWGVQAKVAPQERV